MLMKNVVSAACLTAMLAQPVVADEDDPVKQAIEYRESAMTLIGSNFKPMAGMIKGKIPYDQEAFAKMAKDLAAVASIDILRGFPEDSTGEASEAKEDIWMNWDDFADKMGKFQEAAAKMGTVAATGDMDAIKEQFAATGKTCKSCHDDYKE